MQERFKYGVYRTMYLAFESKDLKPNGDIVEMKLWKLDPTPQYPEGRRYSLVYVRQGRRLVGYDNYHGKGHHRHVKEREEQYAYCDEWRLFEDFAKDIEKINRGVIK
jgi:hypothetical protein